MNWIAVLADVSWKGGLILALAFAVALGLRRGAASTRHLLWTLAVLSLPMLALMAAALPRWEVRALEGLLPDSGLVFRAETAAPVAGPAAGASAAPGTPGQPAPGRSNRFRWNEAMAIAVWAAGAVLLALRHIAGALRVSRLTRGARPVCREEAAALRAELGLNRSVPVLECGDAAMPMSIGVIRPVVILPSGAGEWTPERRRMVLLHELAHVARHDCAVETAVRAVCALFWFHPLVWLANRQILKERERACDDLVLKAGAPGSAYAGELLEIARSLRPADAWAGVAMARRSELEGRLLAILDTGVSRGALTRRRTAGTAVAAALIIIPLAAMQPGQAPARSRENPAQIEARAQSARAAGNCQEMESAAKALAESGQPKKANELARAALELRGQKYGQNSQEYAKGLLSLAAIAWDEPALCRQALEIQQRILGPDNPELAEAYWCIASVAHRRHADAEAAELYNHVLAMRTAKPGAGTPSIAQVCTRLGMLAQAANDNEKAERNYQSALAVDPDSGATLDFYAQLLKSTGREGESKLYSERAFAVHARNAQALSTPSDAPSSARKIGAGITPPKLTFKIEPQYTEDARIAKYEGKVVLAIEVGKDGRAHNIELKKSLGLGLDENAASAVSQWEFNPGTQDGQPVTVKATVEVNFRLL